MLIKRISILLLLLPLAWACGYRLTGTGAVLPAEARTIAVPDFRNATTRFQAEHYVTFAVREKLLRRSRLQLVEDPAAADLFLQGEITQFEVKALSYSAAGAANLYQIRIRVNVLLTEVKTGELLHESRNLTFTDNYETDSGDFFSQETEQLQKIAERLATNVVSAILEGY